MIYDDVKSLFILLGIFYRYKKKEVGTQINCFYFRYQCPNVWFDRYPQRTWLFWLASFCTRPWPCPPAKLSKEKNGTHKGSLRCSSVCPYVCHPSSQESVDVSIWNEYHRIIFAVPWGDIYTIYLVTKLIILLNILHINTHHIFVSGMLSIYCETAFCSPDGASETHKQPI